MELFLPAVRGTLAATLDSLRNSPNLLGNLNQDNPKFVASTLKIISGLAILQSQVRGLPNDFNVCLSMSVKRPELDSGATRL